MNCEELRGLRHKLGLTQSQMAEKLGITLSAIYKLEKGINNISGPVAILAAQLNDK